MDDSKNLISDEELLRCAKECRSSSAFDELLRRYTYYAKALAVKLLGDEKETGIRKEELEQVALISFCQAFKKVKIEGCCFYLYWEKIAKRDIRMYFRENSYLESASQFAGHSFDELAFAENDSFSLADSVGEDDEEIQKNILVNDLIRAINNKNNRLNKQERKIMLLLLDGLSLKDVSVKLKLPLSSVYRSYNVAIKKLRLIIDK